MYFLNKINALLKPQKGACLMFLVTSVLETFLELTSIIDSRDECEVRWDFIFLTIVPWLLSNQSGGWMSSRN